MRLHQQTESMETISNLDNLAKFVSYSFMDTLNADPDATSNGADHLPRQVFSGHYVPVRPTPLENPEYVAHSKNLFRDWASPTVWLNRTTLSGSSPATLQTFRSRCVRLAGRVAMHCQYTAPNTPSNVLFRPGMDTVMVVLFRCWRPLSMVIVGKCN